MSNDVSDKSYSALLRALSEARFVEVAEKSPRQAKEGYFARHHIKAPKAAGLMLNPGAKTRARLLNLREVFLRDEDESLAEEILRRFLLGHRQMLGAVLDGLGIKHEDGLTDSEDLAKVGKLDAKARDKLIAMVADKGAASAEDARLYFDFMALQAAQTA